MARPRKWKMVCQLPENDTFGPMNSNIQKVEIIFMTVEEFECIRLIDLEGLTQEECAKVMDVARTTIQRLYNNARKKIATAMVNGNTIKVEGGNYKLCNQNEGFCNRRHCGRRYQNGKNNNEKVGLEK